MPANGKHISRAKAANLDRTAATFGPAALALALLSALLLLLLISPWAPAVS